MVKKIGIVSPPGLYSLRAIGQIVSNWSDKEHILSNCTYYHKMEVPGTLRAKKKSNIYVSMEASRILSGEVAF